MLARKTVSIRPIKLVNGPFRHTSALTRMLNLLGAELPTNLLAAGDGNELGHWEPQQVVELDDAILVELDSRWSDWSDINVTELGSERLSHYQAEIARIVTEEFSDSALFVVKDPRICRLIPLWQKALTEFGAEVRYAIPFRHPFEVARSLERRDNLPFVDGCLLWLRHLLDAERETRGLKRSFIPYHEMIDDPQGTASRISSELAWETLDLNKDNKSDITSSIDPTLRHQVEDAEALNDPAAFYPWLRKTYEAYSMLANNQADNQAQGMLDQVSDAVDATLGILGPIISPNATLVSTLRNEISGLQAGLATARAEMVATRAEQKRILEQHQVRIANYESTLDTIRTSVSWRVMGPFRLTKRMLLKTTKIGS